mgnify:CR=1 FL=1
MKALNGFLQRLKRGPVDAVGIDIGTTAVKVVRLLRKERAYSLVAADLLPPLASAADAPAAADNAGATLSLPPKLRGRYACLTATAESAIVKLLTFPGHFGEEAEAKMAESLGIENPDAYRIGYKLITEGHGRAESKILAVALPDEQAQRLPRLLPSGLPAPFSVEVSGVAALTAFLHACGPRHENEAVGVIEFGAAITTFALFNKGLPSLVRRFNFGTRAVLDKVREKLGVDLETAQGIMTDGAFDISQPVNEAMDPLIKQLIISRDFVERRENCHIGRLYVSGGIVLSPKSMEEIKSLMEMDVERWNPFENLTVATGAWPEKLAAQEWRFAAALGAALGTFEET